MYPSIKLFCTPLKNKSEFLFKKLSLIYSNNNKSLVKKPVLIRLIVAIKLKISGGGGGGGGGNYEDSDSLYHHTKGSVTAWMGVPCHNTMHYHGLPYKLTKDITARMRVPCCHDIRHYHGLLYKLTKDVTTRVGVPCCHDTMRYHGLPCKLTKDDTARVRVPCCYDMMRYHGLQYKLTKDVTARVRVPCCHDIMHYHASLQRMSWTDSTAWWHISYMCTQVIKSIFKVIMTM